MLGGRKGALLILECGGFSVSVMGNKPVCKDGGDKREEMPYFRDTALLIVNSWSHEWIM